MAARTFFSSGGGAVAVFWASSLSVGLAAFVVLAVIARTASAGGVADASAVLSVSFVLAVVPGAIQLRSAASAAEPPREALSVPAWTWWAAAALLAASPVLAAVLTVPAASLALLAVQFPLAGLAAAQRGAAIGRTEFARASASMGVEAGVRVVAGVALGITLGATGLAAALVLGTAAAAALGARWYPGGAVMATGAVIGPAVSLGVLMLFANLDTLAAPRLLEAAADEYALAALPAKGVFFALFAASWTAVPVATRSVTARALLGPVAVVLALGLLATAAVGLLRPLVVAILGEPEPTRALLVTLTAAMSVAAALATVLAMAIARGAARAWIPALAATIALAGVLLWVSVDPVELARLTLIAQLAVLAVTTLMLLRTLPRHDAALAGAPQGVS
ncbi:MAG: hypothetical protein JHD16_02190 [Solirubrobacteraceae bacterium]|nr:hypothetical protein [Solirubrobacteraceae bacterium]